MDTEYNNAQTTAAIRPRTLAEMLIFHWLRPFNADLSLVATFHNLQLHARGQRIVTANERSDQNFCRNSRSDCIVRLLMQKYRNMSMHIFFHNAI